MSDWYEYGYHVVVTTDSPQHADTVMNERLNYDEDYGFEYQLGNWGRDDLGVNRTQLIDDAATVLSAYDESIISLDGTLTSSALAEIQAAGPVAEALRTLIGVLR
jgi:hypothetical protein